MFPMVLYICDLVSAALLFPRSGERGLLRRLLEPGWRVERASAAGARRPRRRRQDGA